MVQDICQSCGKPRGGHYKGISCELCGSRGYGVLGYLYAHEVRPVRWLLGFITVVAIGFTVLWNRFFFQIHGVDMFTALLTFVR